MTLLTAEPQEPKFLARFEHVWASLRRFQIREGLCWTIMAAVAGLLGLAAADWRWELSWSTRAAGLAVAALCVVLVFVARVVVPLRWWTKPRTAVELEQRFPQLGQRIRTVVQFGGLSESGMDTEGVLASLVDALEEETDRRVQPLPLDRIVPRGRLRLAAALAVVPLLILLAAVATSWEWRTAFQRALLGNRPYTLVAVKPGNVLVDQGQAVALNVELRGRTNREVVLLTRPDGKPDASWQAAVLASSEKGSSARRQTVIEKVNDPIAYRIVAGPVASPTFRINVRYPLALKSFEAALTPPAYTRVKPSTVKGGDLQVIEGTDVTIRMTFDAVPSQASLVVTDPSVKGETGSQSATKSSRVIPLTPEQGAYRAALGRLSSRLVYRIEAKTADDRLLPKNRYKIEVREDRPPRVAFEEPDEALEVHPIAEVMNRIRVGDDFGLTRAGIVFRFNNGDEQTLILKDFRSDKDQSQARTSAALQEWLLLEKLAASPTDSLAYYAFAEDNYPSESHRSETDMRYIDIRPFRREYKTQEGEPGDQQSEDEIITLGELIARQRFNLNRAVRLAKHKPTDKTFAEDPLKIATFEETLANMTREVTEGVEGIIGQRVEPLHAAEESMLAAVEALDRAKSQEAPEHMGDALRHLIEARNTIQQAISDDPALAQKFRQFDRTQAQKIRKKKKEEEDPEAIAERLEELAQEEDFVYATLASQSSPSDGSSQGGKSGKPQDPKKSESPKSSDAKVAAQPDDAAKPAEEQTKGGGKSPSTNETPSATGEPKPDDSGEGKKSPKAADTPGAQGDTENASDRDGAGPPPKDPRREAAERQEKIVDDARELEEKLKKLDAISDLARNRMTKALETVEKASGALTRGSTKEATANAKSGGFQLHELARQVRAEVAKEVAEELARARDLASELAERESDLGEMAEQPGPSGNQPNGNPGASGAGKPSRLRGGMGDLTDAERLERLTEAGKTLEELLKGARQRAEGKAADQVRDALDETDATEIVERMERIGSLFVGGEKPEAGKEAKELAKTLEVIATRLDVLHQEIVSPRLAEMVELDRRLDELMEQMKTLKTDGQITEWHRDAAKLVSDLEKAGLDDAADALREALAAGGWHDAAGAWRWALGPNSFRIAPTVYLKAVNVVARKVQDRIQDLLMKDLVSDRDESTPPEYRELVERYYEVLSKDGGGK